MYIFYPAGGAHGPREYRRLWTNIVIFFFKCSHCYPFSYVFRFFSFTYLIYDYFVSFFAGAARGPRGYRCKALLFILFLLCLFYVLSFTDTIVYIVYLQNTVVYIVSILRIVIRIFYFFHVFLLYPFIRLGFSQVQPAVSRECRRLWTNIIICIIFLLISVYYLYIIICIIIIIYIIL